MTEEVEEKPLLPSKALFARVMDICAYAVDIYKKE